jgi:hypothetical protein
VQALRRRARGRRWLKELITDPQSSTAGRERCSVRKINKTISLAFLAPDLVEAAVDGRLRYGLGGARLCDLPAEWSRQRQMLGLPVWELSHSDQSSSQVDLHRGGIPPPRDRTPKIAFRPETVSAETETQPQKPANCGLLGRLREIFRFERLLVSGAVKDARVRRSGLPARSAVARTGISMVKGDAESRHIEALLPALVDAVAMATMRFIQERKSVTAVNPTTRQA